MKKGKNYYLIVPSSNIYVKNKDNDGACCCVVTYVGRNWKILCG